ncbi:MAG: ribonuclease III [Oscillospiraceae bacterium]|nr:ribonuclease III [Oscillospiraceae bacterium]
MENWFPPMNEQEVNRLGILALAHVGDAVFELLVRARLCADGPAAVAQLHRRTVAKVNAAAQAEDMKKLLPLLTEEESALYKRGRNTKVNSVPHHADVGQYHAATGLEALFGWLYLLGRYERIAELFAALTEE